jgi:hypothetical protein
MAEQFQERRRAPRVTAGRTPELRLERTVRVRVLELSANGALLWTDQDVPVGAHGTLTVLLGGVPFAGRIEVTRKQPDKPGEGHLLGTVVTLVEPGQQHTLEQFLGRRRP